MLNLGRHCIGRALLPQSKNILANYPKTPSVQNAIQRMFYKNAVYTRQLFCKNIKGSFLRGTGTVAVQLTAEVSTKSHKKVGYWLLTCSGMVFVAVVLGGVTRLTESGLSMVTWKLLGEKMPRSQAEWEAEFKRYQEFPEYKLKNKDMTLSEFKWIWHMEFGHRMWGRAIGGVFLLPAIYFWTTGKLKQGMKARVLVLGSLIAAQGLMGWYMVKSGLEDRFHGPSDVPRVSQYRLAAHLSLAFVLYSGFLWSALDHLLPPETISTANKSIIAAARKFKMLAHSSKGMVFFTALAGNCYSLLFSLFLPLLGAFVSGLDAGLVYNSFPKMGDKWVPDDILTLKPLLSNVTENPTTVQFNHRILGITTLTMISTLWYLSKRRVLPRRAYLAANAVMAMGWIQVLLGISTLLTYVPTPLAASHQSGSLVLLSTAVWLTHELKRLPK